ncbi:hypothetical protein [Pseudalkalibacillus berkeleyi]|uniref:DUF4383 domain-containing protein n=1 Tax=Pseudalkalibacillus berkeleyi TaxID=1069813 RepID=A0ABS9H0F5_9BACL|nr:hypothetical protein [Pseudalkalibacillus berkeleyi]MCF6137430.1 hypothetical protein [Pseudalkalibacillus berkeleyi]
MAEVKSVNQANTLSMGTSLKASAIGGVVAGIVFGIFMQMMGKLPMVAMLVGSESVAVGWFVHLMISVIFGLGFGVIASGRKNLYGLALIYGIVLWVVGPLLLMPTMLGMGVMIGQAFTGAQLMNLMTHVGFALILAFVYSKTNK